MLDLSSDMGIVNFIFIFMIIMMLCLLTCNKFLKYAMMIRTNKLDQEKNKYIKSTLPKFIRYVINRYTYQECYSRLHFLTFLLQIHYLYEWYMHGILISSLIEFLQKGNPITLLYYYRT